MKHTLAVAGLMIVLAAVVLAQVPGAPVAPSPHGPGGDVEREPITLEQEWFAARPGGAAATARLMADTFLPTSAGGRLSDKALLMKAFAAERKFSTQTTDDLGASPDWCKSLRLPAYSALQSLY